MKMNKVYRMIKLLFFGNELYFFTERELTIWVQIGPSTESILSDISLQLDEESQCAQQLVDIRIGIHLKFF